MTEVDSNPGRWPAGCQASYRGLWTSPVQYINHCPCVATEHSKCGYCALGMCCKCQIHTGFQRLGPKENVTYLNFFYWLHVEMIMGYLNTLKLIFLFLFFFENWLLKNFKSHRQPKFVFYAHIIFLLDSMALDSLIRFLENNPNEIGIRVPICQTRELMLKG